MIEQFGHEAVYGSEGVSVGADGAVTRVYYDGMPMRDFQVARLMGRAKASVERQRQKESEAKARASRSRRH